MTSNSIKAREVEETSRHNREDERVARDKNKLSLGKNIIDAILGGGKLATIAAANDPQWYKKLPGINVDDKVGFYNRIPMLRDTPLFDHSIGGHKVAYPSFMVLNYCNTFGGNALLNSSGVPIPDEQGPLNVSARSVFAYNRSANAGSTNYDSPDYMQYIIAVEELYANIALQIRYVSALCTYDPISGLYSDVPYALGATPTLVINDRKRVAELIANLNVNISKAASFAIPGDSTLLARKLWLNGNVFLDDNIHKGQFILFKPVFYFKWDEMNGKCDPVAYGTGTATSYFDELQNAFNDMYTVLAQSQTAGIMSGDTIKAYGMRILKLPVVAQDKLTIRPVSDERIRDQIRNAYVIGSLQSSHLASFTIRQTTDGILYQGTTTAAAPVCNGVAGPSPVLYDNSVVGLNMIQDNPTPDDVLEATRFITYVSNPDGNNDYIITAGSEVITSVQIWSWTGVASNPYSSVSLFSTILSYGDATRIDATCISVASAASAFGCAPRLFVLHADYSGGYTYRNTYLFWEINNYREIDWTLLRVLHNAAIMSELQLTPVVWSKSK